MSLLGAVYYNPTTRVGVQPLAVTGLTAIDTSNLRISFTAPATGRVMVRMQAAIVRADTGYAPNQFVGVLRGSTNLGVTLPFVSGDQFLSGSTLLRTWTAAMPVTGLTAGSAQTWDAAIQCTVANGSGGIFYGGGNTASQVGGFAFEIYG